MKNHVAFVLSLALFTVFACDKDSGSDTKVEDKKADDKKAAESGVAGYPNWKKYENKEYGFRVSAPSNVPKVLNQDQPQMKLTNRAFQFTLGDDGIGQLMFMKLGGTAEIDIVAGLDGACKQSIAGISGTMLSYKKVKDNGREARDFEFTASSEGISWKGYGHGVVTGPRTVKAAMAFYGADRAEGAKMAKAFMASFEAD